MRKSADIVEWYNRVLKDSVAGSIPAISACYGANCLEGQGCTSLQAELSKLLCSALKTESEPSCSKPINTLPVYGNVHGAPLVAGDLQAMAAARRRDFLLMSPSNDLWQVGVNDSGLLTTAMVDITNQEYDEMSYGEFKRIRNERDPGRVVPRVINIRKPPRYVR